MSKQLVKYPFKIHALETVEACQPCTNGIYYATEEEARMMCHEYLQRPGQDTRGFVIFRAITIVRPEARPVRVNHIEPDGSIGGTSILDEMDWLTDQSEPDED